MKKVFVHKKTILRIIILFVTLSNIGFIATSAMALTFNDGEIHDIDYHIDESVFVYNNVNPPYGPTTIILTAGGYPQRLNAAGDSIINISGGAANSLSATENTILNMTGGYVGSSGLYLENNSKMYFHGGGVDGFFVRDNTELVMTGGDVQTCFWLEGRTAIIDGGSLSAQFGIGGDANVTISEVTAAWEFFVYGNATVTIYDGEFGDTYFRGDSIVKIYGGEWWDPFCPRFYQNSSVTIYGYGFNVPLGTYTADNNLDYLSGFFSDGSPFEFDSRPSPMLEDGATIILVLAHPITVISPNGGEVLAAGKTHAITWTSAGDIGNVKIEYSVDRGMGWTQITASTDNDGLYDWEVPCNPSDQCLVRILAIDGSSIGLSDDVFSIDCKLIYTPVLPCRIVDTRNTAAGIIGAFSQRNFHVFGSAATINAQGGNLYGCPSPLGEPLAAHINMVAVNPTHKGNLQAFPVGAGTGAGLSVNYNTIDTNLANAGTVKTAAGAVADITVASNFSSTHAVIDVLGYYFPDGELSYKAVEPCRIVDTRKTSAGIIDANTHREFLVHGSVYNISNQGGNPAGCPAPLGEPMAAHINMVAVNPTGKGNLQAFPKGASAGAGLSVNYNTIDTNLANAGTVKTKYLDGTDITVASNFSSAHTAIDVLGYYYSNGDLLYTPVKPCRIADTRKSGGIIAAFNGRDFHVHGSAATISAQGGNSAGCPAPFGEPSAVHINMVAVNPTGKGNLKAVPMDASVGAGLSVNYNTIDTNLANAGTIKTKHSSGTDIWVTSRFSSAHAVIDVLGYYYPTP